MSIAKLVRAINRAKECDPGSEFLLNGQGDLVYQEALQGFYSFNSEVKRTISFGEVHKAFDAALAELRLDNKLASSQWLEDQFQRLMNLPLEVWSVYRPLRGAFLEKGDPLVLGLCTVYSWFEHEEMLLAKHQHDPKVFLSILNDSLYSETNGEILFIHTDVTVRDPIRAREIADARFRDVQFVLRYLASYKQGPQREPVCIFQRNDYLLRSYVAISSSRPGVWDRDYESSTCMELRDEIVTGPKVGGSSIWAMLAEEEGASDLFKRIISAAVWIGKGFYDEDPARSLVQYVFAIETLLMGNSGGTLITPSIASQLAELTAFICGSTLEERIDYARRTRDIYGKRSGVAHGGSTRITVEDAVDALKLVQALMVQLCTKPELCKFRSWKELNTWAEQEKFSPHN